MTGYADETFDWDMHRIAERLESQYRAHPEGPHRENTKIWIHCNSAGGLGMYLYDKVSGKKTHRSFENFIGYTRENYVKIGGDGKLQSITTYYDPVEKVHFGASQAGGLISSGEFAAAVASGLCFRVGMQISGPRFGEAKVLALAHAYEQATDKQTRRPPLL